MRKFKEKEIRKQFTNITQEVVNRDNLKAGDIEIPQSFLELGLQHQE